MSNLDRTVNDIGDISRVVIDVDHDRDTFTASVAMYANRTGTYESQASAPTIGAAVDAAFNALDADTTPRPVGARIA
jgi:ribosome-associated translation inhibitor RaiA